MKKKSSGINLIGLMISSALGAFVLGVIVRVSFTVTNTYQLIKAYTQIESSARSLNDYLTKVFSANGYGAGSPDGSSSSISIFTSKSSDSTTSVELKFKADGAKTEGVLLCSGQQPATSNAVTALTINIKSYLSEQYIKCTDTTITNMPLVSPTLVKDAYLVGITGTNTQATNIRISPQSNSYDPPSPPPPPTIPPQPLSNYYITKGIKLAILLKSEKPVFLVANPQKIKHFPSGDPAKPYLEFEIEDPRESIYLYKLVVLLVPSSYADNDDLPNTVKFKFDKIT